jgi:hypothetical protein
MKIEIGESLTSSYLNHVIGCRVIQTNWKSSGNWVVTDDEKSKAKLFYQKIIQSGYFNEIFKGSSFEQLLKQAEIDVLGINISDLTVYGVDVAFHGAGLNYGSKEETAERILKKIFRSLFVMQTYFGQFNHFHSLFITPKTNPATLKLVDDLINKAMELIDDDSISIGVITNDQFFEEIIDSTIHASNAENDTSELFLRSVKLLDLDSRKENTKENTIRKNKVFVPIGSKVESKKHTKQEMKIGQHVQQMFREAFKQGLISNDEIQNLQNPQYSKTNFNANFEVLRLKTRTIKDANGINRYYSREYFCGNYFLTSQWIEPQWDLYLKWLKKIGYNYNF